MTIRSITIKNYRSIETLSLTTSIIDGMNCSILLGKNESGKSTILKAIALLDDKRTVNYDLDCNKSAKKKNEDIKLIFELDFNHKFYELQCKKIEIPDEFLNINKIERRVDISPENLRKDYFYVYLNDSEAFENYVISNTSKIVKIIDVYAGEEKLTKDNINLLLPTYELCTNRLVEAIIEEKLHILFDATTPKVIFWEPSGQYLINEPIDLVAFKDTTSLSIPLRNIFHISKIDEENIKDRIELIVNDDEERMELSQTLSEEVTKYINKVWVEHKININVTIDQNLQCIVNIEDQDNNRPKFKMEQRSDGFKQFISILLNLSAENSASTLKNKLILLDEPEVHLHPSGIKYLRDELLNISKNNNLLIATHSIYMIDKINLNRHFSVTKEKSVTAIHQIQANNPYEEEVIYESLGTSIFEHISPTTLIFEGKTDKDMFDAFSKKFETDLKIKNISAISANGVDSIPKYVKFFTNGLVKAFIVVDSDKQGRINRDIVIHENKEFNKKNTFEITDLITLKKVDMTLEDLIPKNIIEQCLLAGFDKTISLNDDEPFINQIKNIYKTLNEKDLKILILTTVVNDINKLTKVKAKEKYPLYYEFISTLYKNIHS